MSSLISFITGPIVDGVLKGVAEMRALKQFEAMQGEILEGWVFKMKIAIERAMKQHNVPYEAYRDALDAVDEVVKKEFDVGKL